ncbi:MAG TPA: prepilin-type N-terminal cleavage/methylation domain-containing protein [Spirochaetota bacterium]|nr:prepilin-type N-terminal cleavage/methylation domain-containing protein [Spirochaetota bacterium]HPJ40798.1 prepilin-type N-terminal cleavage/methylation domain-containing protein [Spirochaetota bacterium]HPR36067.1 prepilin-type N-terminal cleavage/methylation domain-containing protein [Spirochaetota bacterium]HRX45981.1 prepilin-type N-terminal cleavage/methylation domain-containing protein [Spirochaetota bacterium]
MLRLYRKQTESDPESAGNGFVLIEVLIAVTILSVVLLSVYSGISSGINIISNSRNYTTAMMAGKSLMNEFRSNNMRGADMKDVPVEGYPDFRYDRTSERYDNPLFGPLPVKKTEITVKWKYKGIENNFTLQYIYQSR